jgi:hypothetical protein
MYQPVMFRCICVFFQMLALREKIEELNKQYKEQCDSKGPRDVTQEFVFRSKLRDLNNSCRVSVWRIGINN